LKTETAVSFETSVIFWKITECLKPKTIAETISYKLGVRETESYIMHC